EEFKQRRAAVLISEGNRVAHLPCFSEILCAISAEETDRAVERTEGRIDIRHRLRFRGGLQLLSAMDFDLGSRLLPLIAIEDAQRNGDTAADVNRDRRITSGVD